MTKIALDHDQAVAALMALRERRDRLAVQLQEPRDEFTDELAEMHRHCLSAIHAIEATSQAA